MYFDVLCGTDVFTCSLLHLLFLVCRIFGVPNFVCFWPWATDAHSLIFGPVDLLAIQTATEFPGGPLPIFCRNEPASRKTCTSFVPSIVHRLIVRARADLNLTPCQAYQDV